MDFMLIIMGIMSLALVALPYSYFAYMRSKLFHHFGIPAWKAWVPFLSSYYFWRIGKIKRAHTLLIAWMSLILVGILLLNLIFIVGLVDALLPLLSIVLLPGLILGVLILIANRKAALLIRKACNIDDSSPDTIYSALTVLSFFFTVPLALIIVFLLHVRWWAKIVEPLQKAKSESTQSDE